MSKRFASIREYDLGSRRGVSLEVAMKVKKITWADIYRDGGSYGFEFTGVDGLAYEFFMGTNAFEPEATESHASPVVYRGSCNDGEVVLQMSWDEAISFIAGLKFDDPRFSEIVAIVMSKGRKMS